MTYHVVKVICVTFHGYPHETVPQPQDRPSAHQVCQPAEAKNGLHPALASECFLYGSFTLTHDKLVRAPDCATHQGEEYKVLVL